VLTGICPECDAEVYVDPDSDYGDIVTCEDCGTDLEIVNISPIEFDLAYQDEEDYDDYDDDYEEDYEEDYESYDYEDDEY